MIRFTTLALVAALAVPATAQVSGSINRDAPKVTNTIEFSGGDKLQVSYTAIHFGEGAWMAAKDDAAARERLNSFAPRRPIGMVHTSKDVTCAGKSIPTGKYDLYFTVHESGTWILNLKAQGSEDAEPIRWGLRLSETEARRTRLHMALAPGANAGDAAMTIAFGNMTITVPVTAAAKDEGGN